MNRITFWQLCGARAPLLPQTGPRGGPAERKEIANDVHTSDRHRDGSNHEHGPDRLQHRGHARGGQPTGSHGASIPEWRDLDLGATEISDGPDEGTALVQFFSDGGVSLGVAVDVELAEAGSEDAVLTAEVIEDGSWSGS